MKRTRVQSEPSIWVIVGFVLIEALITLLMVCVARADETYAPATPIAPVEDVIAGYKVIDLNLHTSLDGSNAQIFVMVMPFKADGTCARDALKACRQIQVTYDAGDATNMLNTLNTANLTNNSLRKRVLTKLTNDGYLPASGTTSGTPGVPTLPTPAPTATPG